MSPTPVRFHDPRATRADFASSMLVRCPRCERIAHFEQRACTPPDADGRRFPHTRLVCRSVAADLRERAPWYDTGQKMTLVARLPAWIKSAKNREEVLRTVDRLRATVITPG
jgi:hypothetical protein